MLVNGKNMHSIWLHPDDSAAVQIIDQRMLPHRLVVVDLRTSEDCVSAIRDMAVRGAPLIGVTAAFGMWFAAKEARGQDELYLKAAAEKLIAARPTAVNLEIAVLECMDAMSEAQSPDECILIARAAAETFLQDELERARLIGVHGVDLIREVAEQKGGEPVQILTHCNAGWLATVDYGTATAPIYAAHDEGILLHVWVSETRPRNQGASLTAWELLEHGVPHTVIVDNAGGLVIQGGMVDLVIVGTDHTTRNGDVVNKIGTYLKALAADAHDIPFYVALPSSSFDPDLATGADVVIEERSELEVRSITGLSENGLTEVRLVPENSSARNWGFDVTPAEYITGFITERGICGSGEAELARMFPELF